MLAFFLSLISCIPREDPPESVYRLNQDRSLPVVLNENSGMTIVGDVIWFINDSGNDSVLYGYSRQTNRVEKTLAVKGVVNTDWEALTQNDNYIYIGDFGNNDGSRRDLHIICIRKADLITGADTIIPAGIIHFSYEDQTVFTPASEQTAYDCEAFVATNDKLILFTKDWSSVSTGRTKIYTVPVNPGSYSAEVIDEWEFNGGLVTDAAWSSDLNKLLMIGYTPLWPFLLVFHDFDPGNISFSSFDRTDFMEYTGTQTESIAIGKQGTLFVSSESRSEGPRLFYVSEEISQ